MKWNRRFLQTPLVNPPVFTVPPAGLHTVDNFTQQSKQGPHGKNHAGFYAQIFEKQNWGSQHPFRIAQESSQKPSMRIMCSWGVTWETKNHPEKLSMLSFSYKTIFQVIRKSTSNQKCFGPIRSTQWVVIGRPAREGRGNRKGSVVWNHSYRV